MTISVVTPTPDQVEPYKTDVVEEHEDYLHGELNVMFLESSDVSRQGDIKSVVSIAMGILHSIAVRISPEFRSVRITIRKGKTTRSIKMYRTCFPPIHKLVHPKPKGTITMLDEAYQGKDCVVGVWSTIDDSHN